MLAGRLPMVLTSGEAGPVCGAEPMVDMLCCERCLLMVFQPLLEALFSVAEG
jgi:hypothetical protein